MENIKICKPKLVVIEGVDCVGKTTLAKKIALELGYVYYYLPQPPLSTIRKEIEDMKNVETRFFYYLATCVAAQPEIKSMLLSGQPVVIDRYVYSTFAMHKVLGATTASVNWKILPVTRPSLGILLTANEKARENRKINRGGDANVIDSRIEQQANLLNIAQEEYRSFGDLVEIETSLLSANEVFAKVRQIILEGEQSCTT
ncbi:MAG: hypothetical protein M1334_04480 [Patescibacteria group bacterium]|nr:hypothetical protein [Patescibacteria group bacterium]